jgi:hypothetical protein
MIDDRQAGEEWAGGGVGPLEEVLVLREAVSKLLDERNEAMEQLEGYVGGGEVKRGEKRKEIKRYIESIGNRISGEKMEKDREEFVRLLEECR